MADSSVRWTRAEAEQAAADALARHANEELGSWDHDAIAWSREARAVLDALNLPATFTVTDGHLEQVGERCPQDGALLPGRASGWGDDCAHEPVYRVVPS